MTVKEAHYHFKLSYDRVDTSSKPDFNEAEVDYFLNEAFLMFINQRYNPMSNKYQKGFEQSQVRIDDLSTLTITYPLQPLIIPLLLSVDGVPVYEVKLNSLQYPYLHFISGVATTQGVDCQYESPIRIYSNDTLEEGFNDPFDSKDYNGVKATFGRSLDGTPSLLLHSKLEVTKLKLGYIKYPSKVSTGNYTYLDGVKYPENTFEVSSNVHQQIVNIAVTLAAMALENPNDVQIKLSKLNIHE